MRKVLAILVAVIIISNLMLTPCLAGPIRKLGRGLANVATGIVEIPKKVYLVSKEENLAVGLTRGFIKGIAEGFVRAATGLYEAVTFPIPMPADFEPIVEPEFVFEEWEQ